jgi:hypothetical protein
MEQIAESKKSAGGWGTGNMEFRIFGLKVYYT